MSRKIIKKTIGVVLAIILIFLVAYVVKKRIDSSNENKINSSSDFFKLAKIFLSEEKTLLVLFQNNMELRPGGGFIGSFAIVKTAKGKVKSYEIHDTSNFDGRIPENEDMPAPMKKIFKINSWKLRDSNYSPDFSVNAQKALDFYYQGKGEEKIDGVVAVNASVLENVLGITGRIKLEGYPMVFESGSALITLERQVEIDFAKQGIEKGDRKDVMNIFLDEILKRAVTLPKLEKVKLAKILIKELENKNLQMYFNNEKDEALVESLGWSGKMDNAWNGDYFMLVDANLGSYKSDYFIKRSIYYQVDFSQEIPEASLKITYNHEGKTKDWMTRDYLTYLRLYLPSNAHINKFADNAEVQYGQEFNKKLAGGFIEVPINSSKTVEIKYTLPKEFGDNDYKLKIQKQSGSGVVPTIVDIKLSDGEKRHFDLTLDKDTIVVE